MHIAVIIVNPIPPRANGPSRNFKRVVMIRGVFISLGGSCTDFDFLSPNRLIDAGIGNTATATATAATTPADDDGQRRRLLRYRFTLSARHRRCPNDANLGLMSLALWHRFGSADFAEALGWLERPLAYRALGVSELSSAGLFFSTSCRLDPV